jgi:hypothetical protein
LPDGEPLRLRSPTQVVMAGSIRFDPARGGRSAALENGQLSGLVAVMVEGADLMKGDRRTSPALHHSKDVPRFARARGCAVSA